MPVNAASRAMTPSSDSSLPTSGPTNSMRRSCTWFFCASRACSTLVLIWAAAFLASASAPPWGSRRISTSLVPPKYCTTASGKPPLSSESRTSSSGTDCGYTTSTSTPPLKSMPKLRPRPISRPMAMRDTRMDSPSATLRWAMKLIFGTLENTRIDLSPNPITGLNRQVLQLAALEDIVRDGARAHSGGEHGGGEADHQRHREALDRTLAEQEQHEGGDEGGDVGVGDGEEGALVAGVHRRMRRQAQTQFLADTFVDQHVGVHRHAQGQHHAGDAGHGQRGLEDRQHRDQDDHVEQQGYVGEQAEHGVVHRHEHHHQAEAGNGGLGAATDVVGA